MFSVDSANIFGKNIKFEYTPDIELDIYKWNDLFNNKYYYGNYEKTSKIYEFKYYITIFAIRSGTKCFLDNFSTIVSPTDWTVVKDANRKRD